MKINPLIEEAHSCAQARGFWDKDRTKGECLVSIIAEIGGAVKAYRKHRRADLNAYYRAIPTDGAGVAFNNHIKDTFEEQLADVCIHLFDFAGAFTSKHRNIQEKYDKEVALMKARMEEALPGSQDAEDPVAQEVTRIEDHMHADIASLQGKVKKPKANDLPPTPLAITNVPLFLFWVTKTVTDIQFNPFPTQSIGESLGKVYYLSQWMGIDIMDLIRIKMAYNRTRTKASAT